ncbi:Glycosyltransferase involved in cell wall bisynthesis [Novosphingobium sp. B1]|nr:Glycosyltransferase involved in cell wall bisynthesis [Novosphingobium sp. B1]
MVHNRYQHAGGEDTVFANEAQMLREAGHEVVEHLTSNDRIKSTFDKLLASAGVIWSYSGYRSLGHALDIAKPDVVHVHNFFPYPSASLFWASARRGIPTVWTLHNFRVMCANGLLYRDNQPCTKCVTGNALPAVLHKCYRGSRAGSAAVAAQIAAHRFLGTWKSKVTRFVALTEFAREQFVKAGLPAERIVVKPNFTKVNSLTFQSRMGALYVGRLSAEKGLETLVRAWAKVGEKLTIVGDGPLRGHLQQLAGPNVHFLGTMNSAEVASEMSRARLLVIPSVWFENFPMTVIEGMATATPILASNIGSLATLISDGVTGLHFNPGDEDDLARVANIALADDERLREIGRRAREHFITHLSSDKNRAILEQIYKDVMAEN